MCSGLPNNHRINISALYASTAPADSHTHTITSAHSFVTQDKAKGKESCELWVPAVLIVSKKKMQKGVNK